MVPISNTLLLYCWVAIGGALGSVARYWCSGVAARLIGETSFSLQSLNLVNDSEWLRAGGNIVGSVVLCLFAVWLGHVLALSINAMKWT